jgi:hypothetical protein
MSIKSQKALLLGFFAIASYSTVFGSEPMKLYSCTQATSVEQAVMCPVGCKDSASSAGYFEILVDKSSRSVMQVTKLSSPMKVNEMTLPKGHAIRSEVFENCKIFDKKNWDCSSTRKAIEDSQLGIYFGSGQFRRMTNGIFKSYIWMETPDRKKKVLSASCLVPIKK